MSKNISSGCREKTKNILDDIRSPYKNIKTTTNKKHKKLQRYKVN